MTEHKLNHWTTLEQFEEQHIGDEYVAIRLGTSEINLKEIVSLELPYDKLMRIKKIGAHIERYKETGELPYVPSVLKSPNGKYLANFGSEVIIVAQEVGLEKIETMIEVAIPFHLLTDKDMIFIRTIEVNMQAVSEAINICNQNRQQQIFETFGVLSDESKITEKGFLELGEVYNSMFHELRNYYKQIAIREGLITEEESILED